MATRRYLGHAAGAYHVATLVIANTWATSDTVLLTIDNVTVTITIGSLTTTAQVATTVKQAFNGETLTDTTASVSPNVGVQNIGQFDRITASVSGSTVTFTADDEGVPFTMSASEVTAGSGTATLTASTVAATGRYHFDNQDNWSGNTVPVDNDTIVFDASDKSVRYGLTPAIQPAAVKKSRSMTGNIGLPNVNADSADKTYVEYRTSALTFDDNSVTCTYDLETGEGQGSSLLRIAAGAGQSVFNVYGAGQRTDNAVPTTLLTGSHTSNVLNNFNGDVGFAFYPDETGTLAEINHGNGASSSAFTYCGSGVTLTGASIEVNGGTLYTNSAISTSGGGIVIHQGNHYHYRGNIGSLTIEGGTFFLLADADVTLATLKMYGGTFDASGYYKALTITNDVELHAGATFLDPNGTCAANTDFQFDGCDVDDVTLTLGPARVLRKTA